MAHIIIFSQDPFHLAPSSEWLFQVLLLCVSSQEELPELEKSIRVLSLKTFYFMIVIFISLNTKIVSEVLNYLKNWKVYTLSWKKILMIQAM